MLPSIISLEQGGFVPSKETSKGAIVAHETLHHIKENQIPTFVIKLDMMKVYDRVNWSFLIKVLEKFGFSKAWCKWIKAFILGDTFSVLINGSLEGFFKSSQGIRQGNPLSPDLFILMEKAFCKAIIQSQWL